MCDTALLTRLRYYRIKFDPARARPFRGESTEFETKAADGVRIVGSRLAGEGRLAFLVVHGLFAHRRIPALLELAEALNRVGPVWTMDLRGHGTSGGFCTLGHAEALDVAAVTSVMRAETSLPIVAIGFSMGAAAVIRSAALLEPVDACIAISGPADWKDAGQRGRGARRTELIWRVPGGLAAARALTGVRLSGYMPDRDSPVEVVGQIAPAPVLLVHGGADPFFPPEEAEHLYEQAGEPKDLWVIPRGGHAEGLFSTGPLVLPQVVDSFAGELLRRLDGLLADPRNPL
ncbi:MAG TPA: alpha/beta fold hydrolase [Actinomycetota bacterium]|nr:alpha/beta fold hydrolase [Actinomycetota bacterium]